VIDRLSGSLLGCALLLANGCNSDVPVSAVTQVTPPGFEVAITRVATHPFLARFNLTLTVTTSHGCSARSELFPDTGGVSRRNLYRATLERLYVIGQFDARQFDAKICRVDLVEFRSLETDLTFAGSFDVDDSGQWIFWPAGVRVELPFEPL
jgi:hypothetical protein